MFASFHPVIHCNKSPNHTRRNHPNCLQENAIIARQLLLILEIIVFKKKIKIVNEIFININSMINWLFAVFYREVT